MRPSKASGTACIIAASLVSDFHDPHRKSLVPALAAELGPHFLKACGGATALLAPLIGGAITRFLLRRFEALVMPGISLHYLLRKTFIDEESRKLLDAGRVGQVVVLGAGFDTLALRLHRLYPQVSFFELDHPATQQAKLRALDSRQFALGPNLHFRPADFTQRNLGQILLTHSLYDASAPTLFIAEGVLVYLLEAEVKKVFQCAHSHAGPQSFFAFSFMEMAPNGKLELQRPHALIDYFLKRNNELFLWGMRSRDLPVFLAPLGFTVLEVADASLFRSRYLRGTTLKPILAGECVAIAQSRSS
jgi:methyltransferase (TIGR00027 family)